MKTGQVTARDLDRFFNDRHRDLSDSARKRGIQHIELDAGTVTELEDRGWVDVEGFEPLAPEEGVYELICGH